MKITRRDMIRGGVAAAACAAVPSMLPRASANGPGDVKNLLIVLNFGGWDTTVALDPKPGLPLVDVTPGDIAAAGALTWWSDPETRPGVDRFFQRWADQTAIINGVQVRSFVHTDCIKRMMTGSPSDSTPDMGAIAAYELGRDMPVPYLALGNQARSGHLASITGRTGTTNQLSALIDPEAAYLEPGSIRRSPGLMPDGAEESLVAAYLGATAERVRAIRGQNGANARRVSDFVDSLTRSDQLAAFAREGASIGDRDYTLSLDVQVPLAIRALSEGLSHTALIQSGYDWDTHAGNAPQVGFHEGLFGTLDSMMDELVTADLLDSTMVVVLSEMGRTPRLNGQAGKDHWPVTSCMVMGAGVDSGVYGGTDDELGALSVDMTTGAPLSTGNQLQSANLVAGVLQSVGVDSSAYLPGVEVFDAFRS